MFTQEIAPPRRPRGYWSKARVASEALRYKSRREFRQRSGGAYKRAFRKGWLEEVCAHMKPKRKPVNYWTDTRLMEEAKRYKTRSDFYTNSASAYSTAKRKGLLDVVCAHMAGKPRRPVGYWTEKRIGEAAKMFQTRRAFAEGNSAAYHAAKRKGVLGEVCAHMKPRHSN